MSYLTSRTLATGVTSSDLIHIVKPYDTTQNPVGSSYKASIQQVFNSYYDIFVTGATYNNANTFTFTNNTGGTFNVSFDIVTGITANTISATTYQNLPTDIRVTGGTYSAGTATFTNNTGGTFNVTGFYTGVSNTNYGVYSQTGNSSVVSGTTAETSIVGGGVGTLTVPANGFSVGDSFSVKMFGDLGSQNNDTLTIKVKSGSVILGDTGTITMPGITNSHFMLDIGFTIRATGSATNASITTSGFFSFLQNASNNYSAKGFSTINNTTFDTTTSNTLTITAQFNSTNSNNFIYSEYFVLNKVF